MNILKTIEANRFKLKANASAQRTLWRRGGAKITLIFLSCLLTLSGCVITPSSNPGWNEHHNDGRVIGESDAASGLSQNYHRHDNRYDAQFEDAFRRGYDLGYRSWRAEALQTETDRWTIHFEDGRSVGESDATSGLSQNHRRHRTLFSSQSEDAFRQGYNEAYDAYRSRPGIEFSRFEERPAMARARALLSSTESLTLLDVPPGSTKVIREGYVKGYSADCYAVAVPRGKTLHVSMATADRSVYFNIHDVRDQSGATIHRGTVDGMTATIDSPLPATYLIRPLLLRPAAQRGERAEYTMTMRVSD